MGKRGKHRDGYHLALLYALELHYRVERRRKGNYPSEWQPLPRKRPEQFHRWVFDSLAKLGLGMPKDGKPWFALLEARGLGSVACALEHALRSNRLDALTNAPYGARNPAAAGGDASDKHPQVRKLAKALARSLDSTWRETVTRAQQQLAGQLSESAFMLGCLPPGLRAICDQVLARVDELKALGGYEHLTAAQFYALATGRMPSPDRPWDQAVEYLSRFGDDELALLRTLSESQLRLLRALGDAAEPLLALALDTYNPVQWHAIASAFCSLPEYDFQLAVEYLHKLEAMTAHERERYVVSEFKSLRAGNVTVKFLVSHAAKTSTRFIRLLRTTDQQAWRRLQRIDAELAVMVARKQVPKRFRRQLGGLNDELLHAALTPLDDSTGWIDAYLEDGRIVRNLLAKRTTAQLDLCELFPQSIALLDDYFRQHMEEILLEEAGEVLREAKHVADWCMAQFLDTKGHVP